MRDDLRTRADEVHGHPHDAETIARADAVRSATQALRLCLAGDGAAGLTLYRRCAGKTVIDALPLGFQARLIEQAGFAETAGALRRLAVQRGGDLAWQTTLRPDTPPQKIAEEYDCLFAQGFVNARMIGRYAQVLTALGRTAAVAALFDFPRLLHRATLGDAAAVARTLTAAEADLTYRDTFQITHAMRHLGGLERLGDPVFDALLDCIHGEVEGYIARFSASDHPLAALVPREFTIEAWGMVSRAAGYNVRHHHPVGWVTGVYYPAGLPAGSVGGALRIGGWSDPVPPGWPDTVIIPEPGLFVLMPSWYVHWSEPIGVEGMRLSIALDAIAR